MGCTIKTEKPKTKTYKVTGKTLEEVWKDVLKKGPKDPNDNKRVAAITSTELIIADRWEPELRGGKCLTDGTYHSIVGVKDMTMTLVGTITLPTLGSNSLSKPAKKEWDRFIGKLTAHEQEHMTKAKEVADTISAEVMKLTGEAKAGTYDDSFEAGRQDFLKNYGAKYSGAELSKRLNAAHAKFDKSTKHGASHGASLDTSIK